MIRIAFVAVLARAAVLIDHAAHTKIEWTDEELLQPYREFPLPTEGDRRRRGASTQTKEKYRLFGARTFESVYVNGYGSISFDWYQLGIDDTQAFTGDSGHKIIIAPWWAKVDTPTVFVMENGQNDAVTNNAVEDFVIENFDLAFFPIKNIFTVTWEQSSSFMGANTEIFQVVIVTDGYHVYAIFSYGEENQSSSVPTWTQDEDGMVPISGIIVHNRQTDLCFKTTPTIECPAQTGCIGAKDAEMNGMYAYDLYNPLDCTNCESFTECGDMKESDRGEGIDAMNLQYSYNIFYQSVPESALKSEVFQFYAMVQCNEGFQLDAAGNDLYKRECVYDSDMYETEWMAPTDPTTGNSLICKEKTIQNVQMTIAMVLDNFPPRWRWLLFINPMRLSYYHRIIWYMAFQRVFMYVIFDLFGTSVSIKIDDIKLGGARRRRQSDPIMGELSLDIENWILDSGIDATDLDSFETWFTEEAEDAGALEEVGVVDEVIFEIGFEDEEVTQEVVEEAVIEVINQLSDDANNVTELTETQTQELSDQMTELEDSKDCLGKGVQNVFNPNWVKPDSCCGPRPYNRDYLGCCTLSNGQKRTFDLNEQQCCGNDIINDITLNCATMSTRRKRRTTNSCSEGHAPLFQFTPSI